MKKMKIQPIFDRIFRKLYGLPGWNVQRGWGSFITFEFGQPRLEIYEPRSLHHPTSERVRRIFARRQVSLKGEWHLWIYCCAWRVFDQKGKEIGQWESKRSVDRATRFLQGQKLEAMSIILPGNRSVFSFDLGGRLETKPYDRKSQQWMLFTPSRKVLSLRADKCYSYQLATTPEDEEVWHSVWQGTA